MNTRIFTSVQSHRARLPVFLVLGVLLLVLSACSPGSSVPPSTGSQTTSVPQTAVPAAVRDVNSMNACTLFPGADVATALSTTLVDPNNPGTGIGPNCTYYLTGTGGGHLYNLFLLIPDLYNPSLSALENAQPVAGLGDQAMMGTRVGTTTIDLMVLKAGDIFIEVNGDDAATAQKLAEYVLTHLP